jgi:hypothetical protein
MNGKTYDINDHGDAQVQQLLDSLAEYGQRHPNARIEVRRQNSVAIRIRILDADLADVKPVDREDAVWPLLEALPEDIFSCITMVLLLTPDEAEKSIASAEFDDPIPSAL